MPTECVVRVMTDNAGWDRVAVRSASEPTRLAGPRVSAAREAARARKQGEDERRGESTPRGRTRGAGSQGGHDSRGIRGKSPGPEDVGDASRGECPAQACRRRRCRGDYRGLPHLPGGDDALPAAPLRRRADRRVGDPCRTPAVPGLGGARPYGSSDPRVCRRRGRHARAPLPAPQHRRRGIGTQLLEQAHVASPSGLTLRVFTRNTDARAFYERRGFRPLFPPSRRGRRQP